MSFRRTIWAWDIPDSNYVVLEMPKDAEILYFGNQNNIPRIWALIDPDEEKPKEKRVFRVVGTGHDIHENIENFEYVGSFIAFGVKFVLHLFEIVNIDPTDIPKYENFNRENIDDDGGFPLGDIAIE